MVHECLESWWSIAETKEHDSGLKEAEWGDECSLPLVFFSNVNVVITPSDVKLGEQCGIFHIID